MAPISEVWFHRLCFWLSTDVCLISTIRTAISAAVSNTHTPKQPCSLLLSCTHRYAHWGNISLSWLWVRLAIIWGSPDLERRANQKSWLLLTPCSKQKESLSGMEFVLVSSRIAPTALSFQFNYSIIHSAGPEQHRTCSQSSMVTVVFYLFAQQKYHKSC